MKTRTKRVFFILLAIFFLFCLGIWLLACMFATGQLYNSYNIWIYMSDAPVAVLIIVALFAAFVASIVAAIRVKDK